MYDVKKEFLERVVVLLDRVNIDNMANNKDIIDRSMFLSIMDSSLDKYVTFITEIGRYKYEIGLELDDKDFNSLGMVRVHIFPPNKLVYYEIKISSVTKLIGYCTCTEDDKCYNEKYECCGIECDWKSPRMNVKRTEIIGESDWEGNERDYWEYKETFESEHIIEDAIEYELQQKRDDLVSRIEALNEELDKINESI